MLAEHGSVVPVNEPLIGFYLGPFLSDTSGLSASELDASNCMFRQVRAQARGHFFSEEFSDVWMPGLATMMLERFHAHAVKYPADVPLQRALVAVKEPNGSQSADIISRTLPRSRLLFLLRDGRDVVDSELAAIAKGAWASRDFLGITGIAKSDRLRFVIDSAYRWLWRTGIVQAALATHPGPTYLVRYEDLRAHPIDQLTQILRWLGLENRKEATEDIVRRHAFEGLPEEKRGPTEFARSASPGAWRVNLSEKEKDAIHEILGPKLQELGYISS
jgi:hypothetical protein